MRKVLPVRVLLLACLELGQAQSDSISVFRCVDSDGAVSYQDQACPDDVDSTHMKLPRADERLPANAAVEQQAAEPQGSIQFERNPPAPPAPPPTLWLCTDVEGNERESSDGVPEGRYVPLWVVGRDPYAPAQTFGRVGRPKPRPRVQASDGPRTQSAEQRAPSPLVYVEERCRSLSPQQTCDRYRDQLRELQRQLFNSQSSERARLEPDSERLRRVIAEHCSR